MKTTKATQVFMANRKLKGLSNRTLETYGYQLNKFEKAYPKFPFNPDDIQEFIASQKGSPELRHSYYRTLRAFYNFLAKRYGYKNPMLLVDAPKVPNKMMPTLEALDIDLLFSLMDKPRDRALMALLLDTGVRASEATGLMRKDIHADYIKVDGKVGQRAIPLSESTKELLLNLPENPSGYVFYGKHGKLTRSGAYSIVKKCLAKVGIKDNKLGPHRLRHSFGRHYLVNGGDLRSLQLILGHSNISTTEKYASLAMNDVVAKHHKYTPLRCLEGSNV